MIANKDFMLVTLAVAMLLSICGMMPLRALGFSALVWLAVIMFCNTGLNFIADPPREKTCWPCGFAGAFFTCLAVIVLAV